MKKLIKGALAPKFQLTDIYDNHINLNDSDKWTYLTFQRYASCPFCNIRTNELINSYSKFKENDINIISVWPSSKENMLKFVGEENAPFPLIMDPNKSVYEKYGVNVSSKLAMLKLLTIPKQTLAALKAKRKDEIVDGDQYLLPASFLINPKGEIVIAYYGKHIGDHISINELIKIRKNN